MGSQKRLISLLANEDNRQDVAKLEEPFERKRCSFLY